MAAFFCKKLRPSRGIIGSSWRRIIQLQRVPFAPPIEKFFSSDRLASKDEEQELVIAAASSKKVSGNAELVKTILTDYGFTDAPDLQNRRLAPLYSLFQSGQDPHSQTRVLIRDEVLLAFRSHPLCMYLSEEKLTRAMDFLVKKMGWKTAAIARCPVVIFFKLEKRIKPRCAVIKCYGNVAEYIFSVR